MSSYKTVLFDFEKNRIKLGDSWCNGLYIRHKDCVRLAEKTIIPARCEKVVAVKCHRRNSLLSGDFEPNYNIGKNSIYINRARVNPNSNGVFFVVILNTTDVNQVFESRKVVGNLYPNSDLVANILPD